MKRTAVRLLFAAAVLAIAGAMVAALSPDARAFARKTADRVANRVWNIVDPPRSSTAMWGQLSDPATAVVIGPPDAPENAVVVLFVDYNCVHCRRQFRELDAPAADGPRFRIVLRHKPYTLDSIPLAQAMLAARLQNGEQALHRVLAAAEKPLGPDDLPTLAEAAGLDPDRLRADAARPEIEALLDGDIRMAWNLRIKGTPTMVTTGKIHRGVQSRDHLTGLFP